MDNNDFQGYLQGMARDGTYGDHLTLQRISEMFYVRFIVVSSLGYDAMRIISPTQDPSIDMPIIALGHLAEGNGERYLTLTGTSETIRQLFLQAMSNVNDEGNDMDGC